MGKNRLLVLLMMEKVKKYSKSLAPPINLTFKPKSYSQFCIVHTTYDTKIIQHFLFGPSRRFLNVGDTIN